MARFALLSAVLATLVLVGCSSPEPEPTPAPPATRVVVEVNVERYVDAVDQLSTQPACCAVEPTQEELDSGRVIDSRRKSMEEYGRAYCDAIIRGVPVEDVVMEEAYGSGSASSVFAQDSARVAADPLPVPLTGGCGAATATTRVHGRSAVWGSSPSVTAPEG